MLSLHGFRPHDWGSFFNPTLNTFVTLKLALFVPMIGDLFLIRKECPYYGYCKSLFVPMIGDLFLIIKSGIRKNGNTIFSSP